tara:strand:+ start:680 stop:973 length:294 start_codon:yes stop_codon:yes gene_type:complete
MSKLTILKDKIEAMNKLQQIEILRILSKHSPPFLNENNNGTFVNLTSLPDNLIIAIEKYVAYVQEQQSYLQETEKERLRLDKTYFKGNKEVRNIKLA